MSEYVEVIEDNPEIIEVWEVKPYTIKLSDCNICRLHGSVGVLPLSFISM